ncbi:MAG: allophanate hydrolase subunit 1 [Sporolactobacillus sp.]
MGNAPPFTFHAMGDHVLNLKFADDLSIEINERVQRLKQKLEQLNVIGIEEMIPTMNTLSIIYDPMVIDYSHLEEYIRKIDIAATERQIEEKTVIHIPVTFSDDYAPDMRWILSQTGLTKNAFIDILTEREYYVYMIGFIAAGPYMGDTPEQIRFPRRSVPRVKVRKGTVSIATKMTNIYTVDSPGGWHLVGWTPMDMFDYKRNPPSPLKSGYYVKYDPISQTMAEKWSKTIQNEWDKKWHQSDVSNPAY